MNPWKAELSNVLKCINKQLLYVTKTSCSTNGGGPTSYGEMMAQTGVISGYLQLKHCFSEPHFQVMITTYQENTGLKNTL